MAEDLPGWTIFFVVVICADGVTFCPPRADALFEIEPTRYWLEDRYDVEFVPVDEVDVVADGLDEADDKFVPVYPVLFFLWLGELGFVITFCFVEWSLRFWSSNDFDLSCSSTLSVKLPVADDVDVELLIVVCAGAGFGGLEIGGLIPLSA